MAGFKALEASARTRPATVETFPPSIFASTWKDRPADEVAVGLRIPSDNEVSLARANAAQRAWDLHPKEEDFDNRLACMNDALVRELCACGMTDANDARKKYFHAQEDAVFRHLTQEGAKAVYDRLERLVLETSPVHREASDGELRALAAMLEDPTAFDLLPGYQASRARRLLAFVYDEILSSDPT